MSSRWIPVDVNDLGPRQLLGILIILGGFFYILNALWGLFFLPSLPLTDGWCLERIKIQTNENAFDDVCVTFLNEIEERKYHHNIQMEDRNNYWVMFLIIVGPLLLVIIYRLFFGMQEETYWEYLALIPPGIFTSLIVPLVLSWILPDPLHWFPDWIIEYHNAAVQKALDAIQ